MRGEAMNKTKQVVGFTLGLGLMAISTTAFAHGDEHHQTESRQEIRHDRYHDREENTREYWDAQRAKRIADLRERMFRDRQRVLRKYGRHSRQWAYHLERWEQKWSDARRRERASIIAERES